MPPDYVTKRISRRKGRRMVVFWFSLEEIVAFNFTNIKQPPPHFSNQFPCPPCLETEFTRQYRPAYDSPPQHGIFQLH